MIKTISKAILLMVFLLFIVHSTMGQTTNVSGRITDDSGEGLAGVNIIVQGTVTGTITDIDGNFNLNVNQSPPFTLIVSYVGYGTQEIEVNENNTSGIEIQMEEQTLLGQEVVISASRVEESIMKSPVTIEKMDILAIRESAATSFYDAIKYLKGVDYSAQSITHKTVNARGFASNGNTRFVQLIDGIDNQAPGLNFPVGNIVGISEIDLESAELIPGAASALYGPNALNGILLLKSKSPFEYQGLSVTTKTGVNHIDEEDHDLSLFHKYSLRYGKSFNNKFAFKVVGDYTRAQDFIGVDTRDQSFLVSQGETSRGNNRIYDGVNVYGEPLLTIGSIADGLIAAGNDPNASPEDIATAESIAAIRSLLPDGADGAFTPTGFTEASFVDNTTESLKLGGALHYRLTDNLELSGQFNWGSGSTVYTANDRFVLDNFSIWTSKLELKSSKWFVRAYTTQEDAGDTYAANTVASLINVETFIPTYFLAFVGKRIGVVDPNNQPASIESSHFFARIAANGAQPQPGSDAFNQLFDQFRETPISEGGARFLDKTDLWHAEAMYDLSENIDFANVIVGGNFRRYDLNSEGTLFALEDNGDEINMDEWGAYVQGTKTLLDDNLKLAASLRYDKNENFDGQLSPRFSSVFTIADKHNIRASFQQGFRIPTTQDQFIDLDVVTRRLIGSNDLLVDRYNFETNTVYTTNSVNEARTLLLEGGTIDAAVALLEPVAFEPFEPEKVNTFEIGYKSVIGQHLFIDAYYYFSSYRDFIAEIDFTQAVPNGLREPGPADPNSFDSKRQIIEQTTPTQRFGFDVNADGTVDAQGWALGLEYTLPRNYIVSGNVAWNELIDQEDLIRQGFRANYNTPEYRTVISLKNRRVIDNLGFNLTWRWQEAFLWESSFGVGVIPDYHTLDAQVSYKITNLKTIVKLGGTNVTNERYTTSFGNPRLGAIYYISLNFDEFLN